MLKKQIPLFAAIIFAALTISASLIFFALQLRIYADSLSTSNTVNMGEVNFQQKVDDGINAYIKKKQTEAATAAEEKVGVVKPVSEQDHILGDKNAEFSLIEYSDFECPFCKVFHPTTKQIVEYYQGKVNIVYRHYPLDFHQNARKEAEASECANELGGNDRFWEFADKIFERTVSNGVGFPIDGLVPLAKEIGLNELKFKACLDSGKYTQLVEKDITEGLEAGVSGTPGNILINHRTNEMKMISGAQPFEVFQAAIDTML